MLLNGDTMKHFFFAIVTLLVSPGVSIALVAAVGADGYSFSLAPVSASNGDIIYFTTYDGSSGVPLLECGAVCIASEEFYPNGLGSTQYVTDYLVADYLGIYEYGTYVMNVSSSDADGDGMLDVLELQRPGGFSFSGATYPDWNAFDVYYNSTVSGSTSRSPGVRQGTYSGTFSNPTQTASFAGIYALSGAYGTVEYFLDGDPTLYWNLSRRAIDGTIRTFIGASSVSAIGTDTLIVPSFLVYDSQSAWFLQTFELTLTRSGNTFRGTLELVDGELGTSWRDYIDFKVEIVDNNDTNGDGLPDIIYAPEPSGWLMSVAGMGLLIVFSRLRTIRPEKHG
jgi:hypothetical protein